jgi:hypothetical protein
MRPKPVQSKICLAGDMTAVLSRLDDTDTGRVQAHTIRQGLSVSRVVVYHVVGTLVNGTTMLGLVTRTVL